MRIKTSLEREVRRRKLSLVAVLDLAADEWLKKSASPTDDNEEQHRRQQAALKCFGSIAGSDPLRSENASWTVRERLRRRYGH
jgi:hypothetical protein